MYKGTIKQQRISDFLGLTWLKPGGVNPSVNLWKLFCRFEKRIYIPLPEASARVKMFELHMGNLKHSIQPPQFRELAEKTDG